MLLPSPALLEVASPAAATFTLRVLIIASVSLLGVSLLFVAITIALRYGNVRRGRRWSTLERRWENDLLEMLSGEITETPDRFGVEPDEALFFVGVLGRYARRVSGRERELLARLADPYLPAVERQLHGGTAEDRARAMQALALFGGRRYEAAVVRMLDDPSSLVAMAAASALARRETAHRAGDVIARLPRFARARPRVLSTMLARLGPAGAPPLRDLLADEDAAAELRAVAADALRSLNDIAAADVAARILARPAAPRDEELRVACLRLLARIGGAEHVEAARRHLEDAAPAVRAASLATLAALGDVEEAPLFAAALHDVSPIVGAEGAQALLALGRNDILESAAAAAGRELLAREVLHQRQRPGGRR